MLEKTINLEKLKFSELLLNGVNLIVISANEKGEITYVSPATEKIIGYKTDSLLADNWWKHTYFSDEESELLKQKAIDIISGVRPIDYAPYDRKLKCKDGSLKWIEWRDSLGENNTYVSVGVDVTDWKKTQQKKIQSDVILKNVSSMILVSDKNGNVLFASPSVKKMLGYEIEDVLGEKWWDVTYKDEYEAVRVKNAILKYVFFNEKGAIDFSKQKIKTKTGDYKWIEWQISKGVNNTYISIGTDITNRILTDIELKKAKESAEESLKVKNQFLANMSHEIRTPLNAVIGFADLLLETKLTSEQKEYLESMQNSGEILLSLINNILDLSKLESDKLEVEEISFDLYKLLYDVVKLMKLKANEKHISLDLIIEPNTPKKIIGDPTKLEQILLNLIGNAVKFTNEGSVTISVKQLSSTEKFSEVHFEIKDTGIGILSNKIHSVFKAFTQAKNNTSRIYGGTGLGLTIVKKLVDLFGGEIKVESKFGEGSTFKLNLPLKKCDSKIKAKNEEQSNLVYEPLGLNILLVEDNKTNQLLAKRRLERWKCTVDIANNGIEGVKKTQQKLYDLILMDIQMPVMDGYEATKIIKNDISERVSKIPVIAMTAYSSIADIKRAKNAGMDNYIFKPFKPVELYSLLKKYSKNKSVYSPTKKNKENHSSQKNQVKTDKKNHQYVDLSFLRKETLNESPVLILLIKSFISDFEDFLSEIDKGFKRKNWKQVYAATHKIKPSINMFGISELEPVVHLLEHKSKNEEQIEESEIERHIISCKELFVYVKIELLTEIKLLSNE